MEIIEPIIFFSECSSNWDDAQTGLVVSPILWRCLLRQQCRVIRKIRILSCFLGRILRFLVVYSLDVYSKAWLSTAVKCDPMFRVCVNDPVSIHIPDNWSWQWNTSLRSTEVRVRAHSCQPISLLAVT
jgi:hypothetical protein